VIITLITATAWQVRLHRAWHHYSRQATAPAAAASMRRITRAARRALGRPGYRPAPTHTRRTSVGAPTTTTRCTPTSVDRRVRALARQRSRRRLMDWSCVITTVVRPCASGSSSRSRTIAVFCEPRSRRSSVDDRPAARQRPRFHTPATGSHQALWSDVRIGSILATSSPHVVPIVDLSADTQPDQDTSGTRVVSALTQKLTSEFGARRHVLWLLQCARERTARCRSAGTNDHAIARPSFWQLHDLRFY
jgi:hypothetical protein